MGASSINASSTLPVYTAFWINWSYGELLGSTLTLEQSNANLLLAFIAFYITLVSTQLWVIVCFSTHNILSSREPRHILYHQRQVILRNSASPAGTTLSMARLMWHWRRNKERAARPIAPLLVISLLLTCSFAVATGFSSRVVINNEVLMTSSACRHFTLGDSSDNINLFYLFSWISDRVTAAASYANRCYSAASPAGSICSGSYLIREQLPISVDQNASCPFDHTICTSEDSNLFLHTGFIDSHFNLGNNSPASQRMKFQATMHCAPLVTQGFKNDVYYQHRNLTE